jgi:putative MATE family efflux protein
MDSSDRFSSKALIRFFLPILAFHLIEVGFGIIDTVWVGVLLEPGAIGATSICFSVTLILLGLASGIATGTTVLVARHFGAQDPSGIRRVVQSAFGFSFLFATILTITGIGLSHHIVAFMGTPVSIRAMTNEYLVLSLITFFFTFGAVMVVGVLRGIGDSKTPLRFMLIGAVINTILVPLLITGFGPFPRLGLNGSIIATLIATLVALSLGIAHLYRPNGYPPLQARRLSLEVPVIRSLLAIGMPALIQNSIPPLTGALLMVFVTPFGAPMVDIFGAVRKIDSMALLPAISMGTAVSVFVSQLLGRKTPEPIFRLFHFSSLFIGVISIVVSVSVIATAPYLLSFFGLGHHSGVDEGIRYLTIVGAFYLCQGLTATANGVLVGAGHARTAMLASFFSQICLTGMGLVYMKAAGLGIQAIWWSIGLSSLAGMGLSLILYQRKNWLDGRIGAMING